MAIKVQSKSKILESLDSRKNRATFSESDKEIKTVMRNYGISDKYENNQLFTKFTRFGVIDPKNTLMNTKEYVFITKPDLAIVTRNNALSPVIGTSAFFTDCIRRYLPVVKQLQYSADNSSPFMNILTNSLTSTADLPGISMDSIESSANVFGTAIHYVGTPYKSDEGHGFTLEFEDTKYLDVYMLFKMYAEYEKLKWNGALDFTQDLIWKNYILNKVLHDQFSLYKFIVSDDGYRIIYWARLTGCYPTSVPRDAFSDTRDGGPQKISVGFNSHFCRDMDPAILYQFNALVSSTLSGCRESQIFDYNNHMTNGEWPTVPYIYIANAGSHNKEYYLRWGIK